MYLENLLALGSFWIVLGIISWGYECGWNKSFEKESGFFSKIFSSIFFIIFGGLSLYYGIKEGHNIYGWRLW